LVGALLADARSRIALGWLVCPLAAGAALAFGVLVLPPGRLIAVIEPTLTDRGLDALVRPTGLLLAGTLGGMALLLARHRARLAMGIGVAGTAALLLVVQVAHERVEALFSWRPFAEMIHARAPRGARVFFRASDEYQLCGGLEYYLRQPQQPRSRSSEARLRSERRRRDRARHARGDRLEGGRLRATVEPPRHERVRLGVVHRQVAGADVDHGHRRLEPSRVGLHQDTLALHHSEPRRARPRHPA